MSGYGLDDRAIEVRSLAEAKDFSSSLCVQTGSGVHPASCKMSTGSPFPGAKARPGRDADHSPHLVPRSKMNRSYTFSPPKRLRFVLWDSFSFALSCDPILSAVVDLHFFHTFSVALSLLNLEYSFPILYSFSSHVSVVYFLSMSSALSHKLYNLFL
jgi:hypothetical protein